MILRCKQIIGINRIRNLICCSADLERSSCRIYINRSLVELYSVKIRSGVGKDAWRADRSS
jgi:hypothetical protein